MGLFDIFTGNAQKKAGAQTRGYLQGVQDETGGVIDANTARALGFSQQGTAAGRGLVDTSTAQGREDIAGTMTNAIKYLQGGAGDAGAAYATAAGGYDPFIARASGASDIYAGALGAGGQEGIDRATAAFRAGPGYQFAVDQGLDAINRRRSAAGQSLLSGNADREAQTFGQGTADQEYNNWLKNLSGFLPLELQGITGRSGIQTHAGDVAGTNATNIANVLTTGGRSLADLTSRGGLAGAQLEQGGGQNLASIANSNSGLQTQLALGIAQPYAKTYKDEADAATAGSGNLWNFGLNAAKAAASGGLFGGGGGAAGGGGFFGASGSPYAYGAGGYTGYGPFM